MKTNKFYSDIMRVRYGCFSESPSWSGDFQRNTNNIDFIMKSVYIETLDQNVTL